MGGGGTGGRGGKCQREGDVGGEGGVGKCGRGGKCGREGSVAGGEGRAGGDGHRKLIARKHVEEKAAGLMPCAARHTRTGGGRRWACWWQRRRWRRRRGWRRRGWSRWHGWGWDLAWRAGAVAPVATFGTEAHFICGLFWIYVSSARATNRLVHTPAASVGSGALEGLTYWLLMNQVIMLLCSGDHIYSGAVPDFVLSDVCPHREIRGGFH